MKKTKKLDDVIKKWKISDEDGISDVSNSVEEVTNSKIVNPEFEASNDVILKNLDELSSNESPGQNIEENPQEKTLDEIKVAFKDQHVVKEN
jgi:hypothetical protein